MGAGKNKDRCPWTAILLALAVPLSSFAQQPLASLSNCVSDRLSGVLAHGEFKEAEMQLRRAIAVGASCPDAHFLLGYTLMRQDRPSESLAEYTAAARMRKPTAQDLRNVALDYVLLADYPDADRWIERALAIDATDSENWYVLGRIRYSTGKFLDAVHAFTRTLVLTPGSVKAANNLGLAYEALNDPEEAIGAYRTAISLGDKSEQPSEQPLINLAILLTHRSDLDGALTLLTRALVIAPENVSVREHLGHVYLEKNELTQAQVQLEKAVSLSPQDARLHYLLGQTYRRQGNSDKATTEFSRSASLNGTHSTPNHLN